MLSHVCVVNQLSSLEKWRIKDDLHDEKPLHISQQVSRSHLNTLMRCRSSRATFATAECAVILPQRHPAAPTLTDRHGREKQREKNSRQKQQGCDGGAKCWCLRQSTLGTIKHNILQIKLNETGGQPNNTVPQEEKRILIGGETDKNSTQEKHI